MKITKKNLTEVKLDLEEKTEESKTYFSWFKNKWAQFETWFHTSYLPGLKTRITLYLGMIGTGAATLQSFVTGLPTTKYISAETISTISLVLFVLAFWFRGMGERVEKRIEDIE